MKLELAREEIVEKLCKMIDDGDTLSGEEETDGFQGFERIKNKAEGIRQFRDADDDTYRSYIWELLEQQLDENGDYPASDGSFVYLSPNDRAMIVEQVFGMYRGLGLLDTILMDESVTELMVNGPDNIFVEKKGRIQKLPMKIAADPEEGKVQLRKIIHRIVDMCGRDINESKPIVDARLKDGSRVNIVLHPIALGGDTITIRKFSKKPMSMEQLIDKGSLSHEVCEKLRLLVQARFNIFISGGTGSGKTTFLNALSNFIPPDERVITIEDSAELQITEIANLVSLETKQANVEGKGAIPIKELIKTSLRMRPDRIVVGEVRGEEALDMLQAMNTGHDGSLSTGHANSARDMISRLETMVLQGSSDLPVDAVRRQVGSAIDIIIHLARMRDHSRKVVEIVEVDGYRDGDIQLKTLYKFEEDRERSDKEVVVGGLVRSEHPLNALHMEKLNLAGIFETI